MALFRTNIEWTDDSSDTLVYKYPFKKSGREVNNKSSLTVRESQQAVFVYKGQVCDVFGPGFYELKTNIYPILTKLASWQYGFETPITLDVYFVNTKQFTGCSWGTQNPVLARDPEYGNVRIRAYGSYAFKVDDCGKFLKALFGTNTTFKTSDIVDHLRSIIVSDFSDTVAESGLAALDLAANTRELQDKITKVTQESFLSMGLFLSQLIIENLSVPPELEKAFDERTKLGILGDKTDTMMKIAAAEAMKAAAENPGGSAGLGVGVGAGVGLGQMMGEAFRQSSAQAASQTPAPAAHAASQTHVVPQAPQAPVASQTPAKGVVCTKCGSVNSPSAKFCSECGEKLRQGGFCPICGKPVSPDAKFCPECGAKL